MRVHSTLVRVYHSICVLFAILWLATFNQYSNSEVLALKSDTKRGLTISDYMKPSRKCAPGVSAPLLLFLWITFFFQVVASGAPCILFSSPVATQSYGIANRVPFTLSYLTLLLPPTFANLAAHKAISLSSVRLAPR